MLFEDKKLSFFPEKFARGGSIVYSGTQSVIDVTEIPGIILCVDCRGGGIGRRTGLKILWTQVRAGSIPALGTIIEIAGWSSPVARRAHNPKVTGSNPVPATIFFRRCSSVGQSKRFIPVRSPVRLQPPPPDFETHVNPVDKFLAFLCAAKHCACCSE